MARVCWVIILCMAIAVAFVAPVRAQGEPEIDERDLAFEQEIHDRLAEINPDAVAIFKEATRALDVDDLEAAKRGFEQVLALAPGFPDASRRLSYVETALDDVESAVEYAEQAYAADGSPYNELALARALVSTQYPSNAIAALAHAWAAAEALPDDFMAQYVLVMAGAMNDDMDAIRAGTTALVRIEPNFFLTRYFAGLLAASDGRFEEAEQELLLAQELGMPAEAVEETLADGIRIPALLQRWVRRFAYATGFWLAGLLVLYLVGSLLSRLTLATVCRAQPIMEARISSRERLVRAVYRVIVSVTSLYFYASIPFLILVVLGIAGGVEYLLFRFELNYQILVFGVLGFPLYIVFAIVRSMFIRVRVVGVDRPLSREEAPNLFTLVEQVAERLVTRPIETIYATPGTRIGVVERGGAWKRLRGAGQRCLDLGFGVLPGMTQGQFEAILAHEYGHFSSRDTAGGNLARQAQASMDLMTFGLAARDLNLWLNPAWLFLRGFKRIFLRITLGASRLQEILADRYAATTYGVENFTEGLRHIVRQSLVFDEQVNEEIRAAIEEKRDLRNLYTLPPIQAGEGQREFETEISEAMSRSTSPWDSHPSTRERIALLERIEESGGAEGSPERVWDLLTNAEGLQMEMTAIVAANVSRRVRT